MIKKPLIAKIVTFFLAGVFLLGAVIYGLGNQFGFAEFRQEPEGMFVAGTPSETSYPVDDISNLEIEWVSGRVEIRPYSGSRLRVTETPAQGKSGWERLDAQKKGSTLKIRWKETDQPIWPALQHTRKNLLVEVPRELELNRLTVNVAAAELLLSDLSAVRLRVSSTAGEQHLAGLTAEKAELSTSSGALTAKSCSFTSVTGKTDSGEWEFNGVTAGEGSLSSVSGGISCRGSYWNLKLKSISGSVEAESSTLPEVLEAESVSGEVQLTVPENTDAAVEYGSISGQFTTTFPGKASKGGSKGEFPLGAGSGSIRLATTSGSMSLRRGAQGKPSPMAKQ